LSPKIQHRSARIMTDPSQITDDTPLRLARAAAIAFHYVRWWSARRGRPRPSSHLSYCRQGLYYSRQHQADDRSTPERSNGPRPWFRCARRSRDGRTTHAGTWLVRGDYGCSESARCSHNHRQRAEQPSPTISSVSRSRRRPRKNVMPLQSRSPTFVDGRGNAMMAWSRVP
jgi:hypothetical protein